MFMRSTCFYSVIEGKYYYLLSSNLYTSLINFRLLEDGQQGGVFVDPEEFGYLLGRREKLVGDTLQFEDV